MAPQKHIFDQERLGQDKRLNHPRQSNSFHEPEIEWITYDDLTDRRDLDQVLLELFSHVADILTFYQDRVTNESYLITSRRRTNECHDYHIVCYNSEGSQEWIACYDGPGDSDGKVTGITVDNDGNIYITGESEGSNARCDFATLQYSLYGIQGWVARYNGTGNSEDGARSIAVDNSGNVYVTGYSRGLKTDIDYTTIKYSIEGVREWMVNYDGPNNSDDEPNALVIDDLGNIYVTEKSCCSDTSNDYATVKYNSDGIQEWVARYNGSGNGNDEATAIAVDSLGNVYVTGYSEGSGTDIDYTTVKYNAAGLEQWVARYNGTGNSEDKAIALVLDDSFNIYVTGSSIGIGTDLDYTTVKYDPNGVEKWVTRYNGPMNDEDRATAMVIDSYSNIYITGGSIGSSTGYDFATIKYNPDGVQKWVARYDRENFFDIAIDLFVDGFGSVYVTGYSYGPDSVAYATIKYIQIPDSEVEQWKRTEINFGSLTQGTHGIQDGFNDPPKMEDIDGQGHWGWRGPIENDEKGNKVYPVIVDYIPQDTSDENYLLIVEDSQGNKSYAGKSSWGEGRNNGYKIYTDENNNGEPDEFVATLWASWDGGLDDDYDEHDDNYQYIYLVEADLLTWINTWKNPTDGRWYVDKDDNDNYIIGSVTSPNNPSSLPPQQLTFAGDGEMEITPSFPLLVYTMTNSGEPLFVNWSALISFAPEVIPILTFYLINAGIDSSTANLIGRIAPLVDSGFDSIFAINLSIDSNYDVTLSSTEKELGMKIVALAVTDITTITATFDVFFANPYSSIENRIFIKGYLISLSDTSHSDYRWLEHRLYRVNIHRCGCENSEVFKWSSNDQKWKFIPSMLDTMNNVITFTSPPSLDECIFGVFGIPICTNTDRGDPTADGSINVLDVLAVINHILGLSELHEDAYCRGDCNGDGLIDVLDVVGIVRVILGIGTCEP